MSSTSSSEVAGTEEFVQFRDLKKLLEKKDAEALAARKRLAQLNCSASDSPLIMKCPDFPEDEEHQLLQLALLAMLVIFLLLLLRSRCTGYGSQS